MNIEYSTFGRVGKTVNIMASKSVCSPCFRADESCLATKWCLHCEEQICDNCVETHRRIKDLMKHQIIDLGEASVLPSSTITSLKECTRHPPSAIDFYCTKHETLCCKRCMAEDHRICKDVIPLEDASCNVKKSSLLYDTNKDIKHLLSTLQNFVQNRKQNKENIKTQERKLQANIRELKQSLVKQLDDMEKSALLKLNDVCQSMIDEMENDQKKATSHLNEINSFAKQAEFLTKNGSNPLLFSFLHHVQSKVKDEEDSVGKILTTAVDLSLVCQTPDIFQGITNLVLVEMEKTPCDIENVKSKQMAAQDVSSISSRAIKSFTHDFNFDGKLDGVSAIDIDKTNCIVIADQQITKMYSQQGKNISQWKMAHCSYDLACHENVDRIVVSLPYIGIHIIENSTLQPEVRLSSLSLCCGITFIIDNIAVGGQGKIFILDINGKHIRTITTETTRDINYLHLHQGILYFTDGTDKVYSVKEDGTNLQAMNVSEIKGAIAVITDQNGHLYVVGYSSNNVVRLSNDGKKREVVLKDEDGIDGPKAICFSKDYKRLFVSSKYGSVIMAFKCEY